MLTERRQSARNFFESRHLIALVLAAATSWAGNLGNGWTTCRVCRTSERARSARAYPEVFVRVRNFSSVDDGGGGGGRAASGLKSDDNFEEGERRVAYSISTHARAAGNEFFFVLDAR